MHPPDPDRDLMIERDIALDADRLWAGWTTPELLVQWFTPSPWVTTEAEIDLRPGGVFRTVMRGPDGEVNAGEGCVLNVVVGRRLVWTSALGGGFRPVPGDGGFTFTAVIEFDPHEGGTSYRATVKHATPADAAAHADMGFEVGWNAALDQLVELLSR
jgi:uncharacterized protein YndB with AHSA1/START domain